MKAKIEILRTIKNKVESRKGVVPHESETINKLIATLEVGHTISIHNVNPFKHINERDYDWLKVVGISNIGIQFEVNNPLSDVIDQLPNITLDQSDLRLTNKMIIQLTIGQVLCVEDVMGEVSSITSIRLVAIDN